MKKWTTLGLIVAMGFILFGMDICDGGEYPNPTNVQYEIVTSDNGASLNITWSDPADKTPDQYVLVVDGDELSPVEGTSTTLAVAGAEVILYAEYGDNRSSGVTVGDFEAVETSIQVWTTADPDPEHPSGFGFTPAGSAQTYAVSDASHANDIDYYISSGHTLTAPMDHLPTAINDKGSAASVETGTYDDLVVVAGPGNYSTQRDLSVNGLYGLWLDDTNDGYDDSDHFGKAFVTGINGEQVSMDVAYQTEAGLRWVATP
jgi:hypothetical protein